jgi:uncharacterized membrane protein YgcG
MRMRKACLAGACSCQICVNGANQSFHPAYDALIAMSVLWFLVMLCSSMKKKKKKGNLTRIVGTLDCLARSHSVSKPVRRQCLIAHFTPLQLFLEKFVTSLFQAVCITLTEMQRVASGGVSATHGILHSVLLGKLMFCCQLVVSLSCALLQSLGRKTFGKVTADVLGVCVSFAENLQTMSALTGGGNSRSRSSSSSSSSGAENRGGGGGSSGLMNVGGMSGTSLGFISNNSNSISRNSSGGGGGDGDSSGGSGIDIEAIRDPLRILFEGRGLALSKQFLTLAQVLAASTPAASPNAQIQAGYTHRLLTVLSCRLSDERICSELLQPVSYYLC